MAQLSVPVTSTDHTRGVATAPVTIVEYGDFECPYCGQAYLVVETLLEHHGKQVQFVFRNFPLVIPHARRSAQAAEAAAVQGRFWEMHAALFENQQALDDSNLLDYAQRIGLDMARFTADLDSDAVAKAVRSQFEGGLRTGVNRTPTFFINNRRHDGDNSYASLEAEILAALKQAGR